MENRKNENSDEFPDIKEFTLGTVTLEMDIVRKVAKFIFRMNS